MTIHREGRTLLFVLLLIFFALNWGVAYFFPDNAILQNVVIVLSIIFYLIILQFFRSPTLLLKKMTSMYLHPLMARS